jgi:hypothetical protein
VSKIVANFRFFAWHAGKGGYNSQRERGLFRIENAVLVDVEGKI